MPESDATTRPRATKQRTADPVVGALVSLSRSGVAVLDIELRFRHVNEPLSCLLGRPVDHLIGQSLTDIAAPIATIAASLCCQAIATGVTQTLTEVQSPNDADGGPVRSWDLRCERVDGDRRVPPVVCLLVDERMPSRSAIEDLRESEHYNRLLIGQFPGVVYTLSLATPGDVLSISPQIEELLGYRPDEIVHVPAIAQRLTHPDDLELVFGEMQRVRASGQPLRLQHRMLRKDGTIVWVSNRVFQMRDIHNRATYWQGMMIDITAEKQTELSQARLLQREQAALRTSSEALERLRILQSVTEAALTSLEMSPLFHELLKRIAEALFLDTAVIMLLDSHRRELNVAAAVGMPEQRFQELRAAIDADTFVSSVARDRRPLHSDDADFVSFGDHRADMSHALGVPLIAGTELLGVLVVGAARDWDFETDDVLLLERVAERIAQSIRNAQLYRNIADHQRQLQELVHKLFVIQEEERRRIAYEIHDDLTQIASSVYQHLEAFAHDHHFRSPKTREQLQNIIALARQTVRESRRVVNTLRPTLLDDLGLAAAIRSQIEELRASGWDITFSDDIAGQRLPYEVETTLFRVTQEALTNIRKHAGVCRAEVSLHQELDQIRLDVRDWGCGFDRSESGSTSASGEQVGLASMRERVALAQGTIRISSQSGLGTHIVAELPRHGVTNAEVIR